MSSQLHNFPKTKKINIEDVLTSANIYIEDLLSSKSFSIEEILASDNLYLEDQNDCHQISVLAEPEKDFTLSESLTKYSLQCQLADLKNNMSEIQNRIDSQLEVLKSSQYSETEDIEMRIKKKLSQISSENSKRPLPLCCNTICTIY